MTTINTLNPDGSLTLGEDTPADRRMHLRVDTRLKAIHSGQNGYFLEDEIINVSRSGFMLETSEALKIGDRVDLILTLPHRDEEFAIQAEVVFIAPPSTLPPAKTRAGLYLSFVEPAQKLALQRFIDELLRNPFAEELPVEKIAPVAPRIRVRLDGPDAPAQADQLQHIVERGLFIEVSQPLSIFSQPRIRIVNPLTQDVHDLAAEVVHAQVIGSNPKAAHATLYGIGVRFADLTEEDKEAINKILLSVDRGNKAITKRPGQLPTC